MAKQLFSRNYSISCLSAQETYDIVRFVTSIDNFTFMIPDYSKYIIDIVDLLQNSTPFKYIVYEREYIIKDIEYYVKNDCLILHFIQ